jgi:hypothetical protein
MKHEKCFKRVRGEEYMAGVAITLSPNLERGQTVDAIESVMEQMRECRLCHELKHDSQYAPHRRQCNRCRNRYTEQVRNVEKRRAHQRVRDRRYRLKLKQVQCDIGVLTPICAQ